VQEGKEGWQSVVRGKGSQMRPIRVRDFAAKMLFTPRVEQAFRPARNGQETRGLQPLTYFADSQHDVPQRLKPLFKMHFLNARLKALLHPEPRFTHELSKLEEPALPL
jgi:hypothetical protein